MNQKLLNLVLKYFDLPVYLKIEKVAFDDNWISFIIKDTETNQKIGSAVIDRKANKIKLSSKELDPIFPETKDEISNYFERAKDISDTRKWIREAIRKSLKKLLE